MHRTLSTFTALLSGAVICASAGVVQAEANKDAPANQQQASATQPSNEQGGSQASGQKSSTQHDYFLASWIGSDNLVEIELNQFASQHASSQEVKDFAQEMIRSHTDLANKINQAVANGHSAAAGNRRTERAVGYRGVPGTNASTNPNAQGSETEANNAGQNNAKSAATGGDTTYRAGAMPGMNAIQFKREVGNEFVRSVEEKLGQRKGEDFDRRFMEGQVIGHVKMLATLEVARKQATPQLKSVLDDAVEVAQKHLTHAAHLLAQLDKKENR